MSWNFAKLWWGWRRVWRRALPAFGLGFVTAVALGGQPALDQIVFTVGTTRAPDTGPAWAYLLWQANAPELLKGRAFAIYQKPGEAGSPAPYQRVSVVGLQTDPAVIEVLLNRSLQLGEDLVRLEGAIDALFQAVMPPGGAQLRDKVAIVLLSGVTQPDHFKNLILLSRMHPAIGLCLGFAHAQPLAGPGPFTFEVRAYDVAGDEDLAVVGRVTLDAANPLLLPAPGPPVQVPEDAVHLVYGDLNAKFRWGTGLALRRLGLLQYGFNVFRMTRAFAEAGQFHLNPPPPELLALLLISNPEEVAQVNRNPILTSKHFNPGAAPGAVADFSEATGDATTFFTADDNRRYDPGGVPHRNGDEFYYFVTARDLLGRDGLVSPSSALVTLCDRFPPDAPRNLRIENDYRYDPAAQTATQVLSATWDQHPNTPEETVVRYHLYRWANTGEMLAKEDQPALNRIGTFNHVDGQATLTVRDENLPGSPSVASDTGQTFWYTVRAEDDGACGGNLSGNSAPAFGVLRDREGPAGPSGHITIVCCRPETRHVSTSTLARPGLAPDQAHYQVSIADETATFSHVEVYAYDPAEPTNLVARAYFPAEGRLARAEFALPRASLGRLPLTFHAIATLSNGEQTEASLLDPAPVPPAGSVAAVSYSTDRRCDTVRIVSGTSSAPVPCTTHHPAPPGGSGKEPIKICIQLTPGTQEWRLYRRVDAGPLSLQKQGLADFSVTQEVCYDDVDYPVNPADLCYYAQLFDEHGNGSPMVLLACIKSVGRKHTPLLAKLEPTGSSAAPQMNIRWFCPPHGVDRFLVELADSSLNPPQAISLQVSEKQGHGYGLESMHGQWVLRIYGKYLTPMAGPAFGQGAKFSFTANVTKNVRYVVRVQAIGKDGLPGDFSNVESMTWSETAPEYPEVPWPALALPPVSSVFTVLHPDMTAVRLSHDPQHPVGIRIGIADVLSEAAEHPIAVTTHADPVGYLYPGLFAAPLFPVVLYRYQVPNDEFPKVSGDITQVSPLMERIAYQQTTSGSGSPMILIHDPFIGAVSSQDFGSLTLPGQLFLLDTQPMVVGARYGYLLVRLGPNKEIQEVIPVGEVEVTP